MQNCRTLILLACCCLFQALAWAGNFSVSPVRLYLTPKDRAVAVTIENEWNVPVTVQAEAFSWSQSGEGEDKLLATDDLIVSPPIAKIPPKGRQILRIARLGPPDLSQQQIYRLVISEVPGLAGDPRKKKDAAIGVEFYLAVSMPVFITPPAAKQELSCQFSKNSKQELSAKCKNGGTAYAQVRKITFLRGAKEVGQYDAEVKYILPGASQVLPLKLSEPAPALSSGPATARILFDDGKSQELNVQIP